MSQVFPAPGIVIGVGRFGLTVLERLGDDWQGLSLAGADATLANLRLIAVRPGGEESERHWGEQERGVVGVARYLGEGDLPSLALDLAILRSLGLIRYRDGGYQVAVPRDAGVVELEGEGDRRLRRHRYFEWLRLSPDPIVAAERLRHLVQRLKDLDVFVSPLLNRVRQGHSPRALMACIGRCGALREGRDPAPWAWLRETARALAVPEPFRPRDSDLPAPLDPAALLGSDWETTGWANLEDAGSVVFDLLPISAYDLGLYDQEGRERRPEEQEAELPERLRILAGHVHRGLVRLWVDLQWERVAEPDLHVMVQARQRDELADSLQQSLEILGELVVRPLSPSGGDEPREPSEAERELPLVPSRLLSGLTVDETGEDGSAATVLARRLARLGLAEYEAAERRREPLLADVPLQDSASLEELRRALNHQARQLFGFSHLARYRDRPTRRPPRLTVFVVGDLSEPFVRETFRPVLREVHAELLRAFSPIFETYREGFDRCLCVTPILWTPHPADPFPGEDLVLNRCEEAAIIDAIHGVRRWVESVLPPGRRCISQIFVNSRVTDTAALSLADAARQTRDFLAFQIRSDLAGDLWLRQTSAGAGGGDLFSSFSCYEIDFPALRCREYLANRLARECLAGIKEGPDVRLQEPEPFTPPPADRLVAPAREELDRVTRGAAEEMAQQVAGRVAVAATTPAREIVARFGEDFERTLYGRVQNRWRELTARQGRTDEIVDELRVEVSRLLSRVLARVRDHSDGLVEDHAGAGGLQAVQSGLQLLLTSARGVFQREEELRRAGEALSLRHRIPDLAPVRDARREVQRAALRKPDLEPLNIGLAVWGLLCPVLGGTLIQNAFGPLAGGGALFVLGWFLSRWHLRRRLAEVLEAIERMAGAVRRLFWGSGFDPAREDGPSVRAFLESRLALTAALATRGFALRVLERAVADSGLAGRLAHGVDVQLQLLARQGEDLGVRSRMSDDGERREDLSHLFGGGADRLIDPEDLEAYYRQRAGRREDLPDRMRELIAAAGGFDDWRTRACLADGGRILRFCRGQFEPIVSEPISDQHFFADKAGRRLLRFVARCYPNLGFGAGFKGYEGLDPDNVLVMADAALVVHEGLAGVFRGARNDAREMPATETLQVVTAGIRPNAAYMMSLVQGIRVHSMRNLKRFESFHDRVALPEDRVFPLSPERQSPGAPLNPLTGYGEIAEFLNGGEAK